MEGVKVEDQGGEVEGDAEERESASQPRAFRVLNASERRGEKVPKASDPLTDCRSGCSRSEGVQLKSAYTGSQDSLIMR